MDTILLVTLFVFGAIALWCVTALVLAGLLGRVAATGERHYQMDVLHRRDASHTLVGAGMRRGANDPPRAAH